jgi:uncharacterized protein (TIGR02598 family)
MKASPVAAGFSLVEVVVALALTTFCLLTLLGLLSVGNLNNVSILDQTAATSLASAVISDLRTTPVTGASSTSIRYGIPVPTNGNAVATTHTLYFDDQGGLSGTVDSDASASLTPVPHYRVTLTFAIAAAKTAVPVRVLVTWPALADAEHASAPSKFIGSFDTVIGLNFN